MFEKGGQDAKVKAITLFIVAAQRTLDTEIAGIRRSIGFQAQLYSRLFSSLHQTSSR